MENQIILKNIEKHTRQQALFTKLLCGICAVILICMLVLTISVIGAANQIAQLYEQTKFVLDNLDTLTWELANADIGSMVKNVGALVSDSQAIVADAMSKLDAINFEALNQAIEDLADIVEPLASISNFFG